MNAHHTTRPLQGRDYAAVRAIEDALQRHGGLAAAPARWEAARVITPDSFRSYLQAGCSHVGEAGGTPVGFLLAQPIAYADERPLTLWVEAIAVHPNHRRRGIAAALYRAFGAQARAAGVQAALARLPPGDAAARALHRRAGFAPHREDTVLWRFGEE
jgi:GNAT superfamily N-acetyltransferase